MKIYCTGKIISEKCFKILVLLLPHYDLISVLLLLGDSGLFNVLIRLVCLYFYSGGSLGTCVREEFKETSCALQQLITLTK